MELPRSGRCSRGFIARRQRRRLLKLFGTLGWEAGYDYKRERSRSRPLYLAVTAGIARPPGPARDLGRDRRRVRARRCGSRSVRRASKAVVEIGVGGVIGDHALRPRSAARGGADLERRAQLDVVDRPSRRIRALAARDERQRHREIEDARRSRRRRWLRRLRNMARMMVCDVAPAFPARRRA